MQRDRNNEVDPNAPVTEQASCWWVLLNEADTSAAERRAFAEWVVRSPERVEAFLQAARLSQALRSNTARWPDTPVEELIRAARVAPSDIASFPTGGREEPQPHSATPTSWRTLRVPRLKAIGIAALAAIAVTAFAAGLYIYLSPQRFATSVGEQRSVVLNDGSIVTLNTSSRVEVRMARDHRVVRLLNGEALFQVAHDTQRPFDVMAAETIVRAIGTQFNVDRRPSGTTVTVVEGRVAVLTAPDEGQGGEGARLPLEAGEQLTLPAQRGSHHPAVHADVATAIAWTQRKLVFEHRSLGEVADEFNRYNRAIIEIRSDELRSQEVTGVFQANDPGSFLAFLSRIPGVAINVSTDNSRFVVTQENASTTLHHAK
jgi:transmembrane sensor